MLLDGVRGERERKGVGGSSVNGQGGKGIATFVSHVELGSLA